MAITFNLDEYASAYLAASRESGEKKPKVKDMALDIADNVCAQGIYPNDMSDAEFDLLAKEIEEALPYYL